MTNFPLRKTLCVWGCASMIALTSLGAAAYTSQAVARASEQTVHANIINTEGETIGTATLTKMKDAIQIHVKAEKLPPGLHGFHVHETGLCEKPDFKTAGAHLNLTHKEHGFKNPKGFHIGDLPNILVDKDGKTDVTVASKYLSWESLLKKGGTSLIIHEKQDDYMTDPAGNSGNRIACGVIKSASH